MPRLGLPRLCSCADVDAPLMKKSKYYIPCVSKYVIYFYSIVSRCSDRGGCPTYAHFWAYAFTLSFHFARSLASLWQSIPFSSFISSHHRLGDLPLALLVPRGAQLIIHSSYFPPSPLPYAQQSSILTFLLLVV